MAYVPGLQGTITRCVELIRRFLVSLFADFVKL
ncbi:MAG: hypothetical protein ACI845_002695 [Gammaproteobacteria bacterium]|jgi:hypothetical protein